MAPTTIAAAPASQRSFTAAEIYGLLKPYEGARLRHTFDGPNDYVDIHVPGQNRINADIREVTADGVTVSWSGRSEFVPFSAIDRLTFRTASLYEKLGSTELVRAARRVAA